jgi:hypothetical protein
MDVVKKNIEKIKGSVEIDSVEGKVPKSLENTSYNRNYGLYDR